MSFLGWTCCWWKLGLDANELLILSAVSPCSPQWVPGPASFTTASLLMECLGWWTPACVPTLTSSSSDTCHWSMSLSVLARPTLSPIIYEQAHFFNTFFYMLNILITGDFFFYVMFSCSCHQISWSVCFRACHVWYYWHYNKQLYFHFSSHCLSAMYYPWNYFSLTPNQRLRRGQMAGFKQLSTDEWSYLPGHWTLFLGVASFGPLT